MKREAWEEIILPDIFQVTEYDMNQCCFRGPLSVTNNAFTYALNEILELPLRNYMISVSPSSTWKDLPERFQMLLAKTDWEIGLSIIGYWSELKVEEGMPNRLPPADGWVHYIYLPFTKELSSNIQRLLDNDRSVVPFWVELHTLSDDEIIVTKPHRSIYGLIKE